MKDVDRIFANNFAQEWIDAWNSHDITRVLSHYAEDIIFSSPLIIGIVQESSGTLNGKVALRHYWTTALQGIPTLKFKLLDVLTAVGCITLYYQGHRSCVAETFYFDKDLKVVRANACYATPSIQ